MMKKKVITSALGLVALVALGSAFSAPVNSIGQTTSKSDVLTTKQAKKSLAKTTSNKSAQTASTQSASTQAASSNSFDIMSIMSNVSMSQVKAAAVNQTKAASLIQSNSSLTAAQSQKIAKELFTNSKYNTLRTALASGNLLSAYSAYTKLSNDGTIAQLQAMI